MNTNDPRAHARPTCSRVFSLSASRWASRALAVIGAASAMGGAGCDLDPCLFNGTCSGDASASSGSGAAGSTAGSGGESAEGPGSIDGQVTDMEGAPLPGAAVRILDRPPVLTDEKGFFAVDALDPTERLAVRVTAPGYVGSVRVSDVGAGQVRSLLVRLLPRAAPVTIDAAMGGVIPFAAGGGVTLSQGSLVDADGAPLTGKVNVSLTSIDPADIDQRRAAPGDYQAKMLDGTTALLESWGMFELFIDDGKGRPAGLVEGASAQVEYPLSNGSKTAPDTTPLFHFNALTAMWEQEKEPAQQIKAGSYSGTILFGPGNSEHQLPLWNFDAYYPISCVQVKLLDKQGAIVANEQIFADGLTYSSTRSALTHGDGIACLPVKTGGQTVQLSTMPGNQADPQHPYVYPPVHTNIMTTTLFQTTAFDANACPTPCPLVATIQYNKP